MEPMESYESRGTDRTGQNMTRQEAYINKTRGDEMRL